VGIPDRLPPHIFRRSTTPAVNTAVWINNRVN
jgi:hypothetical protein